VLKRADHAYDFYVSESQQEKLYALNDSLHRHEPSITERIWQYEQAVNYRIADETDWITDGHCETSMVFTWCADAPELLANGSAVAAIMQEHYVDDAHRANWQCYEGGHNDLFGRNVYPVDGHHNIWFHALYDHLYDDKRLSWAQLSRLCGCYLAFEQVYQCGLDLSQYKPYLMRRTKSLTDQGIKRQINNSVSKTIRQLINSYGILCRRELMVQDQRCFDEFQSSEHPLFDYDLTLKVWLSDPNDYEDAEPELILPYKGILEFMSDDSKQHNQRIDKGFLKLLRFLRRELNARAQVSDHQIHFSSWLFMDVVVTRREKAIEVFEVLDNSRREFAVNSRIMQIPDSWLSVIERMFVQIDDYCESVGIYAPVITEIKENVGSLGVYWDRSDVTDSIHEQVIDAIIQLACQECEAIGAINEV